MDGDAFDFYHWPMDLSLGSVIYNHNIEITKAASINAYNVGQLLRKPNKLNKLDFSLFLIENICLFVNILIGYFVILMAIFILLKLAKRKYNLYNLLTINQTGLGSISFKIAILCLAFSFFLFFNLSILTNMIKTEKATVSTSEFIDSISKLNRTTKTLVTFSQNTTNLFNRLFQKRKRTDSLSGYANFDDFFSKLSKDELDSTFYFMSGIHFFISIYYVTLLNRSVDHIAFNKPTIYYESLRVFIYRKKLDQKLKKILNHR